MGHQLDRYILFCVRMAIFSLCIFGELNGQTVLFYDPVGETYSNTDGPTGFDIYSVDVSTCTSISFSIDYSFSLPWEGSGNMEAADECITGSGCAGDPTMSTDGACNNCWDFLWVRFFLDANEVGGDLIGDAGTTNAEQAGTISLNTVCTDGASNASIDVVTQTWATDESVTFNNITIICWEAAPAVVTNSPLCVGVNETLDLTGSATDPSVVQAWAWTNTGSGVIADPASPVTTATGVQDNETYTLTTTDDNSCTGTTSVTVDVQSPALPMLDPVGPFCENSPPFMLNPVQGGFSGSWFGPGVSGNVFDPLVAGVSTHPLTFQPDPGLCATTNTLAVDVLPAPNAGISTTIFICDTDVPFDLRDSLGGTPDPGGNWSPALSTGTNIFDPAVDGSGAYTYTVAGVGGCPDDFATIDVVVENSAVPILDMLGPYCLNTGPQPLNTIQDGVSGNWSGPAVTTNFFTPIDAGIGTHTLTFTPDPGQCTSPNTLIVEVLPPPDPGDSNIFFICSNDPPFDLRDSLGGSPDPDGTWSPPLSSGTNIFNPAADLPGIYIYVVNSGGQCPDIGALAEVSFIDLVDPFLQPPPTCNNNNTPSDPSDDYIEFGLTPAFANNLGTAFTVSVSNGTIDPPSGPYGSLVNFTLNPGSAGAGDVTVTITDNAPPFCGFPITIMDPGTCSVLCDLTDAGLSNIECQDNGTPLDATDDLITFVLNPSGTGLGNDYTVATNTGSIVDPPSGTYGSSTVFSLEPGTAGSGDVIITITDQASGCTLDVLVADPGVCSNDCPGMIIGEMSGGGTVCVDNCPEDPLLINFNISGGTPPYILDIIVEIGAFPDFPFIAFSNGLTEPMSVCAGGPGLLPNYDIPGNTLSFPSLWTGFNGTFTLTGITDSEGCTGTIGSNNQISISISDLPQANNPDIPVCLDDAIAFDLNTVNSLINPVASVTWYFGDPDAGGTPIQNPSSIDLSETFNIWALVDDGNCTNSTLVTFTINLNPEASDPMLQICANDATAYDLTELDILVNNSAPVDWYFGDPFAGGTIITTPTTADLSAFPEVWALVNDGTCSNTVQLTYTIDPSPVANTFPLEICADDGINYDLTQHDPTVSSGLPVTWYDGEPNNGGTVIITPSNVDLNALSALWALVDDGTCFATVEIQLDLSNGPPVSDPDILVCSTQSTTYNLTSHSEEVSPTATITWYDGNPEAGGIPIPMPNNVDLNAISSLWAIADDGQCTSVIEVSLTITVAPQLDNILPAEICFGDGFDLGSVPVNDLNNSGAAISFHTGFPPSPANLVDPPFVNPPVSTEYVVFADEGVCNDITTFDLIVNPTPAFDLLELACRQGLGTYTIIFETDADEILPSEGTPFVNAGGADSIWAIPNGVDITIILNQTVTGCSDTVLIMAPDCDCPSIPPPTVPVDDTVRACSNETVPEILAFAQTGLQVNWYDVQFGGMALAQNTPVFQPPSAQSQTYYAEAIDPSNGCVSLRIPVFVEILPAPELELPDVLEICGGIVDLDTITPAITNGIAGTGTWSQVPTGSPISGQVSLSDGELLAYTFISTAGNCIVSDTITVDQNPFPEFEIQSIICDPDNAFYNVGFSTDAGSFVFSGGALVPVGAGLYRIIMIPAGTDLEITLSSAVGCDTTITIPEPDCGCPELIGPGSVSKCNSQDTFSILSLRDLTGTQQPGVWRIIETPGGVNPQISGDTLYGQGATAGQYKLEFMLDNAIPGCADRDTLDLFIRQAHAIEILDPGPGCADQNIVLNTIIIGEPDMHVWTTSGAGMFDDPSASATEYFTAPTDGGESVEFQVVISDTAGVCANDTSRVTVDIGVSPSVAVNPEVLDICTNSGDSNVFFLDTTILQSDSFGYWYLPPSSVLVISDSNTIDFEGVDPGLYTIYYASGSATPPCVEDTSALMINAADCSCPSLQLAADTLAFCSGDTTYQLNDLLITTEPGAWSVASTPSGSNPITLADTVLILTGRDPGLYTFVYTLSNAVPDGCDQSISIPLTLNADPVAGNIKVECAPDLQSWSVTFNAPEVLITTTSGSPVRIDQEIYQLTDLPLDTNLTIRLEDTITGCSKAFEVPAPDCSCSLIVESVSDSLGLCPGDSITLLFTTDGGSGEVNQFWITGGDTIAGDRITTTEEGQYIYLGIDDKGCSQQDTIEVLQSSNPEPILLAEDPRCFGDRNGRIRIELVEQPAPPFMVSLSPPGEQIDVDRFPYDFESLGAGVYQINITDANGCVDVQEIILAAPILQTVDLGPDRGIQRGDSIQLKPKISFVPSAFTWLPDTYLTEPDQLETASYPLDDITYILEVVDSDSCIFADEITVRIRSARNFHAPNIFSPNGDGVNDAFTVYTSVDGAVIMTFRIFDRWGNLVWEAADLPPNVPDAGWDGTMNAEPLLPGVYVFKVRLLLPDGTTQTLQGDITLVR